jgi:hypothetical protein
MEVVLHVNAATLPALLEVIVPQCKLVSVRAHEAPDDASAHANALHRQPRFHGGKSNKGISASALVLEVLADGKLHTYTEITEAFAARDFARNSASPAISNCAAEGTVRALGNGIYALTDSTVVKTEATA